MLVAVTSRDYEGFKQGDREVAGGTSYTLHVVSDFDRQPQRIRCSGKKAGLAKDLADGSNFGVELVIDCWVNSKVRTDNRSGEQFAVQELSVDSIERVQRPAAAKSA